METFEEAYEAAAETHNVPVDLVREVFEDWFDLKVCQPGDVADWMDERYRGKHDSAMDFVHQMAEDWGFDENDREKLPQFLCIDWGKSARDLQIGGDFCFYLASGEMLGEENFKYTGPSVYVFSNY